MRIRPGLELASLSDVGCQRENNEDSFGYWEPEDATTFQKLGRLAVVADGMGGHEGGQIASHIAVDVVREIYSQTSESEPMARLLEAFRQANLRIRQRALSSPVLHGMGTTCTAVAFVDGQLCFAHVGDSHLYLLREAKLQLLTRDHSLVAHMVETGLIRAEDAEKHPQKHVLTAALGVGETIEPDFPQQPVRLKKSDVVLLCTDGLWGQLSDSELQEALISQPPQEACRALVKLAKERGGPDNITLQIARVV